MPASASLPVEQGRAVRRAGALGGALVGVGLSVGLSPASAWGFVGLQSWVASLSTTALDRVDADTRAVAGRGLAGCRRAVGGRHRCPHVPTGAAAAPPAPRSTP